MSQRTIVVTKQDYERLTRLLEIYGSGREADAFAVLEEELSRAQVVESTAAPPDVVTMNSRVRFRDTDTGEEFEVTLVYPKAANASEGKISVIAPPLTRRSCCRERTRSDRLRSADNSRPARCH